MILGERVNEKEFLVRVELTELEHGVVTQCIGGARASSPTILFFLGIPELLQPKIAMLRIVDPGDRIIGTGRRVKQDVFYVAVTPTEWKQLSKESNYETDGAMK
jgi:hypothetical protein